ncbi:uncharacterized protein LOC120707675 [Panicum virgatum]|uniref:uncharacterized protein LOC120707675 n=1 Tax=Panicum virgatum TaxID=38727 RepID=UPI0019D67448|nr:uncharacterized protein LOC120707675 [Panicum virgatum]
MDLLLARRRLPLLLLAVLVAASHGVPSSGDGDGGRYDPSMCLRQNYTCGGFSISYPFYIRTGDLLGNTSSYCGYPGLEIQCEEDQAFLELESGKYTVTHIDYDYDNDNLTVQLVDPEVLDWRNGCPRTDHNVTLRSFEWLFYPNTTIRCRAAVDRAVLRVLGARRAVPEHELVAEVRISNRSALAQICSPS